MKLIEMQKQAREYVQENLTGWEYGRIREHGFVVFHEFKIVGACSKIHPERYEPEVMFMNIKTGVFYIAKGGDYYNGAKTVERLTGALILQWLYNNPKPFGDEQSPLMGVMAFAKQTQFFSFFNKKIKKNYYLFLPNHCGQRKSMLIRLEETCGEFSMRKHKRSDSGAQGFGLLNYPKVFLVLSTCEIFVRLRLSTLMAKNGLWGRSREN